MQTRESRTRRIPPRATAHHGGPAGREAPSPRTGAPLEDPRPGKWKGRRVTFDHNGRRLTGFVLEQTFTGPTTRGAIPDWTLTVAGQSGRTLEVSLVESRADFPD